MAAGEPKEDSLLVPGNYEEIKSIAPIVNLLVTIPLNFIINKLWTFKEK